MQRYLQPVAITMFFLIMMGMLFRDHVLPSLRDGERLQLEAAVVADAWIDRDDVMVVRLGGKEIGALRSTAQRVTDGRGTVRYLHTNNMVVNSIFFRGNVMMAAWANRRMELEQFHVFITSPTLQQDGEPPLEFAGIIHQGELLLRGKSGDEPRFARQPMRHPVALTDSIESWLSQAASVDGKVYRLDVMDPVFGNQLGGALVVYEGQETIELRDWRPTDDPNAPVPAQLTNRFNIVVNQVRSTYWLADSGRVVRRQISIRGRNRQERGDILALIPEVVIEVADVQNMIQRYPALRNIPRPPELTVEEMTGDQTEPNLRGYDMLSTLGRVYRSGGASNQPDQE